MTVEVVKVVKDNYYFTTSFTTLKMPFFPDISTFFIIGSKVVKEIEQQGKNENI